MAKQTNLKHTKEGFVKRAREVHGDRYDYYLSEYKGRNRKVTIVCSEHGIFRKTPNNHYKGQGCPKCGYKEGSEKQMDSTQNFIIKALSVHRNSYKYDLVKYVGNKKHINIICPSHGIFKQTPSNHLKGHGCKSCADENKNGYYNPKMANENKEIFSNTVCEIYLVNINLGLKRFLKIGITQIGVENRFKGLRGTFNVLHTKKMNLYDAILLEDKVLKQFSKRGFIPELKFSGYTECFPVKAKNKILNFLKLWK